MKRIGVDVGGTLTDLYWSTSAIDIGITHKAAVAMPPKFVAWIERGRVFFIGAPVVPSGGGYGDLLQRKPKRALEVVLDGFTTEVQARDDYGVAWAAEGGVGKASTKTLRKETAER